MNISNKTYKTFIDTGKVSAGIVRGIALKISSGVQLSAREMSISAAQTPAIETILKFLCQKRTATCPICGNHVISYGTAHWSRVARDGFVEDKFTEECPACNSCVIVEASIE